MSYIRLWCVLLITLGPFVQVRGSHLNNEKNLKLYENQNKFHEVFEKIEEIIVNLIFTQKTNLLKKIEENIELLKDLPEICSLSGKQQTETIKRKTDTYFDPCYNLTAELHIAKEIVYNGTDIIYELSIDVGDIVGKLTQCAIESPIQQLRCLLKTVQTLDQYVEELGPRTTAWVKLLLSTTGILYSDFTNCYYHREEMKAELVEVSKKALTCIAEYKFLKSVKKFEN